MNHADISGSFQRPTLVDYLIVAEHETLDLGLKLYVGALEVVDRLSDELDPRRSLDHFRLGLADRGEMEDERQENRSHERYLRRGDEGVFTHSGDRLSRSPRRGSPSRDRAAIPRTPGRIAQFSVIRSDASLAIHWRHAPTASAVGPASLKGVDRDPTVRPPFRPPASGSAQPLD